MANILNQVRLSTLENVTLTTSLVLGTSRIDGVLVAANDRILVKAQTNKTQNGIYTISSLGVWSRASDFLSSSTQTGGTIVFVQEGTTLADTGWVISSNGSLIVGTDQIEFEKFSINLKLAGIDLPSSIVLRAEKGYPLTIAELDNNFKYLSVSLTEKLNIEDYTPTSIRDKINTLTAAGANLNAWKLDGHLPDVSSNGDTIALRSTIGELTAVNFNGDLVGNASTSTLAARATIANNVDGVVAVANGGTGATSESAARASLAVVALAGDYMTGKLVFAPANTTRASINITPGVATPVAPVNGDIWNDTNKIYFRLNGVTQTIAQLDSPTFVGAPTAPTMDNISNNTSIATTAFVKNIRTLIDADLALKAPLASPSLTGVPLSVTPDTTDNSTKIATTAFTNAKINDVLLNYTTTTGMNSAISTALSSYTTTTGMNSAISTALSSYYTKTSIDSTLSGYYTRTQTDDLVSNAVSVKAATTYVDGLQDKWGTSKKYVQSTAPTSPAEGDIWFKI